MKLSHILSLSISVSLLPFQSNAIRPTSHLLSASTEYVAGDFEVRRNAATISTPPVKPERPSTQRVLVHRGTPQALPYENIPYERILRRIIPGQDGRSRIENTNQWPHQ